MTGKYVYRDNNILQKNSELFYSVVLASVYDYWYQYSQHIFDVNPNSSSFDFHMINGKFYYYFYVESSSINLLSCACGVGEGGRL